MRRLAFAICHSSTAPLNCRTGHTILKTYRTEEAARTALKRLKNRDGCWIGRWSGDSYMRMNTTED